MQVAEILEQIRTTKGSIAKSGILKEHAANKLLQKVLKLGLDNFIPFNIVKVPKVKDEERRWPANQGHDSDEQAEHDRWSMFFNVAEGCATRRLTGNTAIAAMHYALCSANPEEEKWMRKILQKKLSIGIATKSVNKIHPGLIPTFEVALAQQFEPKRIKDMDFVYVEPKLDGIRCFAIVENGKAQLFARSGKLISNFDSTIGAVLGELGDGCYDGELMGEDFVALMRQAYRKDNAKIDDAYISLFDYLPLKEWKSGDVIMSTRDRYTKLKRKVASLNLRELITKPIDEPLYVSVVDRHEIPAEVENIMALHHTFVQEGYEGAMVKTIDAPYRFGRSYDVMKVKQFHDVDLPIIGLEEGTGRHQNKLGAVKVNYNGVDVKVGSGFSDEERELVWEDQASFIDRVIEVRYQEVTPDGSLRFPTFVCFRNDRA